MGGGGARCYRLDGFLNGEHVGAGFVPLAEHESIGGEVAANFDRVPAQDFFEHGNEDGHGVVAEHGAARHAGDEFGFRDGDGQAVMLVHVHHDRKIGAAVAHVDDVVVADAQGGADFREYGDLAPAGGGANDGGDFAGVFVVAEACAEDAVDGDDTFERGLDD